MMNHTTALLALVALMVTGCGAAPEPPCPNPQPEADAQAPEADADAAPQETSDAGPDAQDEATVSSVTCSGPPSVCPPGGCTCGGDGLAWGWYDTSGAFQPCSTCPAGSMCYFPNGTTPIGTCN